MQIMRKNEILTFIPFVIFLIFALVRYLSFFQPRIFLTLNRETKQHLFQNTITGNLYWDDIMLISLGIVTLLIILKNKKIAIAISAVLVGIEIIFQSVQSLIPFQGEFVLWFLPGVCILIYLEYMTKRKIISRPKSWKNLLYAAVPVLLFFEAVVFSLWIAFSLFPQYITHSPFWRIIQLEYEVFYAFSLLSSGMIFLVCWGFLIKPAISKTGKFFKINQEFRANVIIPPRVILTIAIVVSAFFAIYPFMPTFNPEFFWVSTDDHNYQLFIAQVQNHDNIIDQVRQAFLGTSSGDRPLTLLLMHWFHGMLGGDIMWSVRLFVLFLGPLLVFSTYYLVKTGTGNRQMAAYCGVIAAISQQLVVGMYGGFFANWTGLAAIYFCFAFLIRIWDKPSGINYLGLFGFSILSFLFHIYAGAYLILVIGIFLIISLMVYRLRNVKRVFLIGTIFMFYIGLIIIRIILGGDISASLFEREDVGISIYYVTAVWQSLTNSLHYYLGGTLGNAALFGLALVWVAYAKYDKTFDRVILAALFVGALPILFGNPVMQSRILYDIPIHIAAGIAVWNLVNRADVPKKIAKLGIILITIHIAIYAIRSLVSINLMGINLQLF